MDLHFAPTDEKESRNHKIKKKQHSCYIQLETEKS